MKGEKKNMNLESLGHAAGTYQRSPQEIKLSLCARRAAPALTLNEIDYYQADDIVKAVRWLDCQNEKPKAEETKNE
jgi:hypothetical protein